MTGFRTAEAVLEVDLTDEVIDRIAERVAERLRPQSIFTEEQLDNIKAGMQYVSGRYRSLKEGD